LSESKNKGGRPPQLYTYTREQTAIAIEMASQGEPMRRIIDAMCTNEWAFLQYKLNNPKFTSLFEQARQEGLEYMADQLITISDEYQDVQRARLKSDNYKWLLSKRKPAVYGDKIDLNINQTIDIGDALKEARARALTATTSNVLDMAREVAPIAEDDES
jgi:hypothetical protein